MAAGGKTGKMQRWMLFICVSELDAFPKLSLSLISLGKAALTILTFTVDLKETQIKCKNEL